MKKHEKHCCGNPNRICGFCATDKITQRPLEEIKKEWDGTENHLKKLTRGCPACMLSVIIQTRPKDRKSRDPDDQLDSWFDFKKERDTWWAERNDAAAMAESSGNY